MFFSDVILLNISSTFFIIRISFAIEEIFFIPITKTSPALENTRFDLILDLREGIYIYAKRS